MVAFNQKLEGQNVDQQILSCMSVEFLNIGEVSHRTMKFSVGQDFLLRTCSITH